VHVLNILRRVAIVFGLLAAGVLFWLRRVDSGAPTTPVLVDPIVPARLSSFRVDRSPDFTPGKGRYSIRLDDFDTAVPFIVPNSRVDVLVVMDRGQNDRAAKLFMENIRVLAVSEVPGSRIDRLPIASTIVTVEVTPAERERLAIAVAQGQLHLMLRGYDDPEVVQTATPPPAHRVEMMEFSSPCTTPAEARPGSVIVRNLLRSSPTCGLHFQRDSAGAERSKPD
jgi:Flp pilus assembly protein CpaB